MSRPNVTAPVVGPRRLEHLTAVREALELPLDVDEQATAELALDLDQKALHWLDEHPSPGAIVLAYTVTGCCGGKVCDVRLRREKRLDRPSQQLRQIAAINGRDVLVDFRIVDLLPARIPVTARGVGPLKGLRLNLEGEQWARLLYS